MPRPRLTPGERPVSLTIRLPKALRSALRERAAHLDAKKKANA